MQVTLTLDTTPQKQKPTSKSEITSISNRLNKYYQLDLEEFAQYLVQPYSYTWCPGVYGWTECELTDTPQDCEDCLLSTTCQLVTTKYNKVVTDLYAIRRKTINWMEQQVFALDFDGNLSYEEFLDRAETYGVYPNIVYSTFSSIDNNKYRAVYALEIPVDNPAVRDCIQQSLQALYPEADNTSDAARMFYGGKELLYEDYFTPLDVWGLIMGVVSYIRDTQLTQNVGRAINNYCQKAGIENLNGLPRMEADTEHALKSWGEKRVNPGNIYNILIGFYRKSSLLSTTFCAYPVGRDTQNTVKIIYLKPTKAPYNLIKSKPTPQPLVTVDTQYLLERCRLAREYVTGERKLSYMEAYPLINNLCRIKGGKELLKAAIQHPLYYNSRSLHKTTQEYCTKMPSLQPHNCVTHCQYAGECKHPTNLTMLNKRGGITMLKPINYISLGEGEHKLKVSFQKALESDDTDIHVIQAPTALGKTELYLTLENVLIAVPTHKLKDEIVERARARDNYVLTTPELPPLHPAEKALVERYYAIGAYRAAATYLQRLADSGNRGVEKYLEELEIAEKTESTVITTHDRLLVFKSKKHKAIIIDEDILKTLLPLDVCAIDDLYTLSRKLDLMRTERVVLDVLLEKIEQAPEQVIYNTPKHIFKHMWEAENIIKDSVVSSNVLGFLSSVLYMKEVIASKTYIRFIGKRLLPTHTKVIILSATVNPRYIEIASGDYANNTPPRITHAYNIGHVKPMGALKQCCKLSFSRYQLEHGKGHIEKAKAIVGNNPVITFKAREKDFPNTIATFGALQGLDTFKGQDLYIVGTPHIHPTAYVLYGAMLGAYSPFALINEDNTKGSLKPQMVQYGNYEFYFNTYSDNYLLQQLQLYLIESELIQAIGRARLLRHDCTVTVLSNLPITGAEFVDIKTLEAQQEAGVLKQ